MICSFTCMLINLASLVKCKYGENNNKNSNFIKNLYFNTIISFDKYKNKYINGF